MPEDVAMSEVQWPEPQPASTKRPREPSPADSLPNKRPICPVTVDPKHKSNLQNGTTPPSAAPAYAWMQPTTLVAGL
ncbi:hypothetical protein ACRALDRAFT_1073954 [Sodiomyces alcalophilus JCM 7366]|uniref:uncharacterized protein n=1 Tax=Sodiomyces alcalophilus JCM 7366 TaxID=591952 RepID=UPI0039B63B94